MSHVSCIMAQKQSQLYTKIPVTKQLLATVPTIGQIYRPKYFHFYKQLKKQCQLTVGLWFVTVNCFGDIFSSL